MNPCSEVSTRIALALLAMLISLPAGAVTFNFDDFGTNAPGYTCASIACGELSDAGYYYTQATIVKDGLGLTIERPSNDFEFWQTGSFPNTWIIDAGDPSSLGLFHLAFSTPLVQLSLDTAPPWVEYVEMPGGPNGEKDMWVRAYLYDSDGNLLEDQTWTDGATFPGTLSFAHAQGIAELVIGHVRFDDPDCIDDCVGTISGGGFYIDDVVATPVPEPSTALLVALGLGAIAGRRRLSDHA